jgi:hypothetical protein
MFGTLREPADPKAWKAVYELIVPESKQGRLSAFKRAVDRAAFPNINVKRHGTA